MDDKTRNDLGITDQQEYDFELTPVCWRGQFLWAWRASDLAARIAARLGLLSLVLGVLGLVLGVLSFF